MKREDIFRAINNERARQDAMFPGQWDTFAQAASLREHAGFVTACTANAILGEEAGEVAKAVLERDDQGLEHELVQVAAVCVAWLEARS